MPRVKGGPRARNKHKKIIKQAKGYRLTRSKLFKRANEAVLRAGEHAFHGRKQRKRDMKTIWIQRINGALSDFDINYSRFIKGLKDKKINLNRKMLSEIALHDPEGFKEIVQKVSK